jgi:hypothetical protein
LEDYASKLEIRNSFFKASNGNGEKFGEKIILSTRITVTTSAAVTINPNVTK